MRHRYAIFLAALALGGCGPRSDDPSNPPKLGQWEKQLKIVSIVVNDVWVERKALPLGLPDDKTEVLSCVEPSLRTSEEINAAMMRDNSMCTLGPIERNGSSYSSTGTCGPKERGPYMLSGTIDLTGEEREDLATGKISAQLLLKGRTGFTDRVRLGVELSWKRLGECVKG